MTTTPSQRAREAAADLLEASGRIPPGKYREDILRGEWDDTEDLKIIHKFEADTLERAWQPIETAPDELLRCFLWCSDIHYNHETRKKEPHGLVLGRFSYGKPWACGMNGDWTFTHWMPLPPPPGERP